MTNSSNNIYKKRIENFKKIMDCDCAILVSRENFNTNLFYFTGFTGYGILVIFKNKKPLFLTTKLYVFNLQNKNLDVVILEKKSNDVLQKSVKRKQIIGLDYSTLTIKSFRNIKTAIKPKKYIDVSDILIKLREEKDDFEIDMIKKACNEASNILESGIKMITRFTYESELKNFLEFEVKKRGYDVAFDTIVASGKNSANAHYSSCDNKLRKGFVVIDFGVKVGRYHSDMTRTIYIGNPSKDEMKEYEKVLAVQEKCIELAKENKNCEELYNFAKENLGDAFIHGLGHGVGLEIHELPNLTLKNKEKIKNNSCFTIEPGVYYPDKFGIRIEDTVLKKDKKIEILTHISKKLVCVTLKKTGKLKHSDL
jgi:Xaa-Pro aminopeptidase